ncbi:hypothetical protein FRB94_000591 [Tulasnella sp. JGI-2019a]|nr:hypothetical protein FRB93_013725 [Tulasnella sp. JGI-2019a]KAG9006574.1 hypothetical protein FRB94_000591 [Tulasnella sp. JGI-2019a]
MDTTSFITLQNATIFSSTLFLIGAISFFVSIQHPPFPSRSPPRLTGLPFLGPVEALTAPWRLFQRGIAISRTGNFSFNLAHFRAVGLTSPLAREAFFNHPGMGFTEGYNTMFNPNDGSTQEQRDREAEEYSRRLKALMTKEWLEKGLENLISDVNSRFDELGTSGMMNPFYFIHEVVFHLTVGTVGCREIAEDPVLRAKALDLVEIYDSCNTASTMLFPQLPVPSKFRRLIAGIKFYQMMDGIVAERKRTGRTETDPLQFLMEQGDTVVAITKFIYGSLFAGVINTGVNASWTLCQLATNPEWMAKARAEITELGAKYADDLEAPLAQQLRSVPLGAWESELPILDLCVKETLRLHFQNPMLRRNISAGDIEIGDEVVPKDAIVFFFTSTVMMDATKYRDPELWDPSRFLPDRAEDKIGGPHTFLAWGSGKHPCRGMRFAKLEMNIIFAFFLARFQYDVLDGSKTKLEAPPKAGPRNFQLTKEDMHLRYQAV